MGTSSRKSPMLIREQGTWCLLATLTMILNPDGMGKSQAGDQEPIQKAKYLSETKRAEMGLFCLDRLSGFMDSIDIFVIIP
jgi:hypothetical protein